MSNKVLLRLFLVFTLCNVYLINARPQLGDLGRTGRGFLSDIVRASVDEDTNRGKLAVLIAENGGDSEKIKDALKKKVKSKIPFFGSDEQEEEEEEERRRQEEEDKRNDDSSISSLLLRKAKDKVKDKLSIGSRSNDGNDDDDGSFFGSLFD